MNKKEMSLAVAARLALDVCGGRAWRRLYVVGAGADDRGVVETIVDDRATNAVDATHSRAGATAASRKATWSAMEEREGARQGFRRKTQTGTRLNASEGHCHFAQQRCYNL